MVDRAPSKVSANVRIRPRCALDAKALNVRVIGCSSIHSMGRSRGGPKSLDEQIMSRARKRAMALGKSLNQVIRDYLEKLAGADDPERSIKELEKLSGRGIRAARS